VFIATLVLSVLLAVFFALTGAPKAVGAKLMHDVADHFHLPETLVRGIGALELAGSAGLIVGLPFAPLGVAAAAGLTLLMTGAVAFHARAHDPAARLAGPAIAGLVAMAAIVFRAASA
jgi:hypothetical protein